MDIRASEKVLLPMLKRTSFEFNVYAASTKFMRHLKKIQLYMKDGLRSNLARLNVLTLEWE